MNIISLLNTENENENSQKNSRATTDSFSLEHEDYNSTTNALAIIQYLTCPKCLNILNDPVTFQCGNSLCRRCLPSQSLYTNELIRKCKCPINGCGRYHSPDCKTDVTLQKLTDICRKELSMFLPFISRRYSISSQTSDDYNNNCKMKLVVEDDDANDFDEYHNMSDSEGDDYISSSRLINCNVFGGAETDNIHFDLRKIKELLMAELDCQICFSLFIDPITTPCGHSFCKSCITRSLDHSPACPMCRNQLYSYNTYLHHPINKTIYSFIRALYPSLYSERRFALECEIYNTMQDTPMFVANTLVFPKMPCYLNNLEPRHKLMIRRCMQSRQMRFGMVLARGTAYENYGTMLEIRSAKFLTDGRSFVETIGTYRFKIIERGLMDGYDVGRIERIDDISPEEEERIEREEIRSAEIRNNNPLSVPIREYTTSELIGISRDFIETLRNSNSPWILQRLVSVYGDMPEDPSDFSYWVASVIPISEAEKYKLLTLKSVRERLKLIVEWITSLRDQWWFSRGCSIS